MSAPAPAAPPAVATARARRVSLRAAPRREPPFDDELGGRHLRLVGPLDRPLPFGPAPRPTPHSRPTVVGQPAADALPDAGAWARRLLIGISETAAGRRPMQQLSALLSPSVAHGLSSDFERAAQLRRRHWTHAATVRSVHATHPRAGVAELCATVAVGDRIRAVAVRLEAHHGRWRCTRLQWG